MTRIEIQQLRFFSDQRATQAERASPSTHATTWAHLQGNWCGMVLNTGLKRSISRQVILCFIDPSYTVTTPHLSSFLST